ncbi:MAG: hypothetical protein Kow00121_05140 [Elainellaceae cyanobacterium]
MFDLSFGASVVGRSWARLLKQPLVQLLLAAGFIASTPSVLVRASEAVPEPNQAPAMSTLASESTSSSLADGVYLYGQSPEPDQIGSAYMVFEVDQGRVIGAFYMPRSSFDCFYGDVEADQLALTIVNSYEQTQYPYAIALEPNDSLATNSESAAPMGLEGFHSIDMLTENDQRILSTCQADYQ